MIISPSVIILPLNLHRCRTTRWYGRSVGDCCVLWVHQCTPAPLPSNVPVTIWTPDLSNTWFLESILVRHLPTASRSVRPFLQGVSAYTDRHRPRNKRHRGTVHAVPPSEKMFRRVILHTVTKKPSRKQVCAKFWYMHSFHRRNRVHRFTSCESVRVKIHLRR